MRWRLLIRPILQVKKLRLGEVGSVTVDDHVCDGTVHALKLYTRFSQLMNSVYNVYSKQNTATSVYCVRGMCGPSLKAGWVGTQN